MEGLISLDFLFEVWNKTRTSARRLRRRQRGERRVGAKMRPRARNRRSPMPYYPRKRPLSPRQQKFVEQYLICGVARQAAIRAGYSLAGAGAIAWRLRRMPHVAKA